MRFLPTSRVGGRGQVMECREDCSWTVSGTAVYPTIVVGGNGLPAMAASPQAQDLRLLRRVSRLFPDGPRCLRL